ncbi:MAG: TetR/AcrR family transcriptional regulator [Woeseiaceae bacterium]|nr:TetR/AcrR family transcriptional regulator [Woeseiaceae bacterium]
MTGCSMSHDMSAAYQEVVFSDRKQQILQKAIGIIASEGYGKLTMRGLARASDMKLGALQYHFRTWEDMLHALAACIANTYRHSFEALKPDAEVLSLRDIVRFILDDVPGSALQADRLFPQLWAMSRVEPVMETLLDGIYVEYLDKLEKRLVGMGSKAPRAEALALMSLIEGATLFVGRDRRWAEDADAVRDTVLAFVDARYGNEN